MKLNEAYQSQLADITQSANRTRATLRKFAKRFPDLPNWIHTKIESRENVTCWFSTKWGGTLQINLHNLDSFKSEALVDLLMIVETAFDIELTGKDIPEYSRKEFTGTYKWDEEESSLDISVTATLSNISSQCQRVQIGVKTEVVETPIYRLDCQESEV